MDSGPEDEGPEAALALLGKLLLEDVHDHAAGQKLQAALRRLGWIVAATAPVGRGGQIRPPTFHVGC